jgi:hypothetical protein
MAFGSGPVLRASGDKEKGCSFLKKRTKKLLPIRCTQVRLPYATSQKSFASFLQKRRLFFLYALFALSACGTDPRLATNNKGTLAFAPVHTDTNAEAALGKPKFADGVPVPAQGFVIVQASYGDTTTYIFNAQSGLLTGIWSEPAAPGFTAPPPERHSKTVGKDERTALIRLTNLAWGARHPASGPDMPHTVSATVWLLDGQQYKALDGYRAGEVINDAVQALAQKLNVVPDNHEK